MQSESQLRSPGVQGMRAIQPGSWAKIDRHGERFWVKVIDMVSCSGTFTAIVDNELDKKNPLRCNDILYSVSISEVLETVDSSDLQEFLELVRKGREDAPCESCEATATKGALQWRLRRTDDGRSNLL